MLKQPCLLLAALCAALMAEAAPLPLEQAGPGIYVHHGIHRDIDADYGGDICNIGFIVGEKGVAVIDTGGSPKIGRDLREAIRQVTPLPVLYVINTHVHPDHIFGNAAFKDEHPVFAGHERLTAAMSQRQDGYLRHQPEWAGADAAGSEIIPPTLSVKVGESITLDIGNRILRLTAYPIAHTTNDLTVLDTKTQTLWTGDLLFVERTPSIDGDIKGWINVIDQVKQVDAIKVVPGHGGLPKDWRVAMEDEKRYLNGLLTDVREAIHQGRTMEQTLETANRSEQGKWALFDIVNKRNVNNIFPALEWE